MSDASDALEILELTLIPRSSPAVYAVGVVASRITFADQQRRAVNVVWALLREGRVQRGDEIAIVGAGIAGATAAVYARQQGLRVTIFEKFADAFPIQQGSGRWIHPNVYDWPADGWRDDQTALPCMNWRARAAGEVIADLRVQWHAALESADLRFVPRTEIVGLSPDGAAGYAHDSVGQRHGPYRCFIMAAGFGEEPARTEIEGRQYWRDDDLHQRVRDGAEALVSGCGDGGLIDAVRIALRDFRHDWLAEFASAAASDAALVGELLRIERDTPAYPDGDPLTQATIAAAVAEPVVNMLRDRLRPDTTVLLNGRADGPITRGACMLNRFLIVQLMKLGAVSYRAGRLDVASIKRVGSRFEVLLDGTPLATDLVVIRHGPATRPLARFPSLEDALRPVREFLMTYSAGVDRTRKRTWRPLPMPVVPGGGTLPPLVGAVLDYLGQRAQEGVQDSLVRLNTLGTVAYERRNNGIALTVRVAEKLHSIEVTLPSRTQLSAHYKRASGETRTFPIDLTSDVMADAGSASDNLSARVPEIIEWLLEERA